MIADASKCLSVEDLTYYFLLKYFFEGKVDGLSKMRRAELVTVSHNRI